MAANIGRKWLRLPAGSTSAIVALAAVMFTLSACSSKKEPPTAEDKEVAAIFAACDAVGKQVVARPRPSGLPGDWDKRIPIPPAARVTAVGDRHGVVRAVDFAVHGDVKSVSVFYTKELAEAGFDSGKTVTTKSGFSMPFSTCGVYDTVEISPSTDDPTQVQLRIVYEPPTSRQTMAIHQGATSQYLDWRRRDRDLREHGGSSFPE